LIEESGYHERLALRWRRGQASLEDGSVVLDPTRAEEYEAFDNDLEGLLWDLADVQRPTDALGFVRRYGLLWNGPDADWRESYADWEEVIDELGGILAMRVWIADVQAGDREEIARMRRIRRSLAEHDDPVSPSAALPDEELLALTSAGLATRVSERLRDVRLHVISDTSVPLAETDEAFGYVPEGDPARFAFMPELRNLVELAYWQAATDLVGGQPLSRCPQCGRAFRIKHGRQQFCSKRCANAASYRRSAEKKKDREPTETSSTE
jgi:endogenous inhibitor of DNA gyrase (YacG/DUF329 family)